jgi:ribulose-phosphate 3-epimerase
MPFEKISHHMTTPLIAPSILSADFARLADAVQQIEAAGADWVHIDVMDGHFVPNFTVGPPMVAALRKVTALPLDVHLMMTNPDDFITEFAEAGADILTVHVETCPHLHRTIQTIKEHKMKAGVSLNPATSVTTLEHILGDVDLVLVMSVNPGFGGQKFIHSTLEKIRQIRTMIMASTGSPYLEVDGGITVDNVTSVLQAGANVLVAGSAIFGSSNMSDAIRQLRTAGQTVTV